ncbi:DUF2911 domain-containing protein [uncultured Paludibaculum sp.]|uniref:DUF2911 domain-containing protein n=1 Tax=uncultured Paludibaculum sp. TaxID=1765020 RepID=UPI002AAB4489|nr:DUF2911 domain-containing protein [uncultured Paludibaculum sp.]
MKSNISTILSLGFLGCLLTVTASAQKASPHETTTATIAGKKITIVYGRPYVKGRDVWHTAVAPAGKVWRTGADEATKFTTDADLMVGTVHVPAGTYSLFTIPSGDTGNWMLILNKTADQWGAFKYEEKQDLGRTAMKVKKLSAPVEQLTITVEPGKGSNGTLKIAWADSEASVPVMVH